MTEILPKRRPRGASAKGDFEQAKLSASRTEEERLAADRKKTEALRETRLRKQSQDAAAG